MSPAHKYQKIVLQSAYLWDILPHCKQCLNVQLFATLLRNGFNMVQPIHHILVIVIQLESLESGASKVEQVRARWTSKTVAALSTRT